jgi:nitrite reductase (cytochrome c-552)
MNENIRKPWKNWVLFVASLVIVFLLGMLITTIVERKTEAQYSYKPKTTLTPNESRNEEWGKNFPQEFESFKQTSDTSFKSLYAGNAPRDILAEDPRWVVLWAGYAFSKDYKQARGHQYAIKDINETLRTGNGEGEKAQPSTCWTCKSPDVPRLINEIGVDNFYKGKWKDKGKEVTNPIGCADCHDPKTMGLTITRPALIEAYNRMGKDIKKATHQEMRSLVCAQCHVEYYFDKKVPNKKDIAYLTFPWDRGMTVEDMEAYYDKVEHVDFEHTLSKAPILKAQHPDYELYTKGIHAERGVSCADCHMPFKTEGGQKFTDHHIQSPLNNVANSCQVCHREEKETLTKNVYDRQQKIEENRIQLEDILVRAHIEAKKAWDLGATKEQMKDLLKDIRHAQWRCDYVAASVGGSFHAPVESGRIIGSGIVKAQNARLKLARLLSKLGFNQEVPMPDISTKAKAQAFIGLDMKKIEAEKKEFIKKVLPTWKK